MGCTGSKSQTIPPKKRDNFTTQIKKLKLQLEQTRNKQIIEATKMQSTLVEMLKRDKSVREKFSQRNLIEQIAQKMNIITIYEIAKGTTDQIIAYIHLISDRSKAQTALYPSFRNLLFYESILNDADLNKMCSQIRKYDPKIKQQERQKIEDEIILHQKDRKKPTQKMCREYVFKLCNQQGLNISEINSVGHKFQYGA